MSESEKWSVTFILSRKKGNSAAFTQAFKIEVDPDEYVLDGIERIWAFHDRSLVFRHACHHSTCGACGMLVNGVEKLTCITTIRSVSANGGSVRVEPLRNFPVVSDLAVDMSSFFVKMEPMQAEQVISVEKGHLGYETAEPAVDPENAERLVDCIECGCCVSACPVALTTQDYLGPAVLAGCQQAYLQIQDPALLEKVDRDSGVWRCHSGYECSEVCPSHVDPAWRIMNLRRKVVGHRLNQLFHRKGTL